MPKKPKKYELTFKDLALIGSTVHKEFDGAPHGGSRTCTARPNHRRNSHVQAMASLSVA